MHFCHERWSVCSSVSLLTPLSRDGSACGELDAEFHQRACRETDSSLKELNCGWSVNIHFLLRFSDSLGTGLCSSPKLPNLRSCMRKSLPSGRLHKPNQNLALGWFKLCLPWTGILQSIITNITPLRNNDKYKLWGWPRQLSLAWLNSLTLRNIDENIRAARENEPPSCNTCVRLDEFKVSVDWWLQAKLGLHTIVVHCFKNFAHFVWIWPRFSEADDPMFCAHVVPTKHRKRDPPVSVKLPCWTFCQIKRRNPKCPPSVITCKQKSCVIVSQHLLSFLTCPTWWQLSKCLSHIASKFEA